MRLTRTTSRSASMPSGVYTLAYKDAGRSPIDKRIGAFKCSLTIDTRGHDTVEWSLAYTGSIVADHAVWLWVDKFLSPLKGL